MARESIFIEEIRQSERPTYEITKSTHADVVVDIFIQALRECFSNHPIYTYIPRKDHAGPDYERTQIVIVDKYTEEAVFLPNITMGFNGANTKWIQFSQSPFNTVLKYQMYSDGTIKRDELGRPIPSHYEYTGAYDGNITFLISANDTIEREELTNLLHVLLVESLRDELLVRGVFVKNVSAGGQTETEYRNDYIYQVPITVEIYSEWKRMIPVGETLESLGFHMDVVDGTQHPSSPSPQPTYIPVYNLENEFYVIDDATDEPVIPCLKLSATTEEAPITLVWNTTASRWEVSDFWIKSLEQTLIPYDNFVIELTKESSATQYLEEAGKAITQAEALRALALSQGRVLPDGSKVIGDYFIFPDGKVMLQGGANKNDPLIYNTVVLGDNTVEFRLSTSNRNKNILIAKNVIVDAYGAPTAGEIYKRITLQNGLIQDVFLTALDEEFLAGENLNTMTAVDLFMIMQFAAQPFRYSLERILEEIDNLLLELADLSLSVINRSAKIANITSVKQELIDRSEKFLLRQPVGF